MNYRWRDTFNENMSSMGGEKLREQNVQYLLRRELQKSQERRTIFSARRLREQVDNTSLN